jgi:hypothetical protein
MVAYKHKKYLTFSWTPKDLINTRNVLRLVLILRHVNAAHSLTHSFVTVLAIQAYEGNEEMPPLFHNLYTRWRWLASCTATLPL